MFKHSKVAVVLLVIVALLGMTALVGCGGTDEKKAGADSKLSGNVLIDGSSTVFPITEAVAEEFMKENPDVRVTVGVAGTGGGFKKWVLGETDINDASRAIKDEEKQTASGKGIEPIELQVAYDGLTVVVNKDNTWADKLTVEELKKIWAPDSKVVNWSDVRPEWPKEKIVLYGPGTDSGTFEYFTEEIVGEKGKSRSDYTASEDDNMLVQGVAGDKNALGYFGYAYYVENKDKIKSVAIDAGKGAIQPSEQTINDGTYAPLSRPLYIYVNKKSMEKPQVKAFVEYYLTVAKDLVKEAGYIALPDNIYQEGLNAIK